MYVLGMDLWFSIMEGIFVVFSDVILGMLEKGLNLIGKCFSFSNVGI